LVLAATILFGAFPLVYATWLSAFYLPMIVMLAALILRGVAFEFRYRSEATRLLWDYGFIARSYVVSLIQGVAVGALVKGLPVQDGHYVGAAIGWLSPFAVLCGVGLCLRYSLLGAGWLTYKTSDDVQRIAFRLLPRLLVAGFLLLAFVLALGHWRSTCG
jgi:cytochrome d ubiquinol oxidase subunit II